jgi:hypothetical protein
MTPSLEFDTSAIGDAAGALWRHLEAKGSTPAQRAMRQLKLKSGVFYAAVGWLAREGKLTFEDDGNQVRLALL